MMMMMMMNIVHDDCQDKHEMKWNVWGRKQKRTKINVRV